VRLKHKTGSTILKEWTTPDSRSTPSTTNLEEEEIADAPGNYGNASMPEQFKRPNSWRKVMMMVISLDYYRCGSLCVCWWKHLIRSSTYLIPASHHYILFSIIFFVFFMFNFRIYTVSRLPWLSIRCEETVILRHAQWLSLLSWGGPFNRNRMPEGRSNVTLVLKSKNNSLLTIFKCLMCT